MADKFEFCIIRSHNLLSHAVSLSQPFQQLPGCNHESFFSRTGFSNRFVREELHSLLHLSKGMQQFHQSDPQVLCCLDCLNEQLKEEPGQFSFILMTDLVVHLIDAHIQTVCIYHLSKIQHRLICTENLGTFKELGCTLKQSVVLLQG